MTGSSEAGSYVYDYATLAYSSAGVPLWTNRYNGPGNGDDSACAVAVDASDNVVVTGSSYDSGSGYDYLTIKYSSAGVPLWSTRYKAGGSEYASAMAVEPSGNVFVTGKSGGDILTIAYSGAGVPLGTTCYYGFSYSDLAVAVDARGHLYVAGDLKVGWDEYDYDYLTLAYSNSGALLWTNASCSPGWNNLCALLVVRCGCQRRLRH